MIKVEIQGGAELAKNLNSLSTRLSRKIQTDALLDGAELIRKAASRFAPHDPTTPADLKDNINKKALRSEGGEARAGIGVPKRFFYDLKQEFGTVHHSAQPFYRPAIDTEAARAIRVIGEAMWTALAGRGGFIRTGEGGGPVTGGPGGGGLL